MRRNAMARDFGWERSVERYLEVYQRALARARPAA
jgi:glycogen synthase